MTKNSNSTNRRKPEKPGKPYPDFPLFPHATGRWAKKIRGKLHYFGSWGDWKAALTKYLEQRDDLHAGRTPRASRDGLTVRDLCNRFLNDKRHLVDTRYLTQRSFADYHATCAAVVSQFGPTRLVTDLATSDFGDLRAAIAQRRGPVALGNEIARVRMIFKYAWDCRLIPEPIAFGPLFKRPDQKMLRRAKRERGLRMFEAAELRQVITAAKCPLKAMILLGVNCGFGNHDVALLPVKALDLESGIVEFPRPKTEIERRVFLWPETIAAIEDALIARRHPAAEEDAGLLFVTKNGHRWVRSRGHNVWIDSVATETAKLLKKLKLKRPGLSFYALRHTFETIGGAGGDQVAVDAIMGHSPDPGDMSAVYREWVDDERLRRVTDRVREWLFGRG